MDIRKFVSDLTNWIFGKPNSEPNFEPDPKPDLTIFHPFPRLPPELRDKIWKSTSLNEVLRQRIVAIVLTKEAREVKARTTKYTGEHNRYPYVSALLWVNHESKEAVQDLWLFRPSYMSTSTRFFNFEQDVFFFQNSSLELTSLVGSWSKDDWPEAELNICRDDLGKMRHLFVTFHGQSLGEIHVFILAFIHKWLKWFSNLDTITIAVWERRGPLTMFFHQNNPIERHHERRYERYTGALTYRTINLVHSRKAMWIEKMAAVNRSFRILFCEIGSIEDFFDPSRARNPIAPITEC